MSGSPGVPNPGDNERLVFGISPELVEKFARLTGDFSSLHTDSDFAHRSMYRENVAHGMLPVLFLPALSWCHPAGERAVLRSISARFLKPVMLRDRLAIEAAVDGVNEGLVEISFSIQNTETTAQVAAGVFSLAYEPRTESQDIQAGAASSRSGREAQAAQQSMLLEELEEASQVFEAIQRGDTEGFDFRILPEHARLLEEIHREGFELAGGKAPGTLPEAAWLAAGLFSTLVGMRLPGRYATFLDFQVFFSGDIRWCQQYRMDGKVRFKSPSTLTLVEEVTLQAVESQEPAGTGKINAKVNELPAQMPSISELRQSVMDLGLKDKVVLVTGGSRGIGETIAKSFALHGSKVALNYLSSHAEAERVVEEIRESGGEAAAFQADVSDRLQVKRMVSEISSRYGTVDILVNSAVRNFRPADFLELTWDEVQKDLDVILAGAFHCCQEVIPLMTASGGGKIINIATVATEIPPAGQAKYVMAKSALVGLTRSLAVEFARHNIQVNMVVPSLVETDLTRHVPKIFLEGMKHDTPLGRNAEPSDVARAVIYLASSLSSFTTGQKLMVTGGQPPFL
jgi:3-oxoacyl-[acyl-carrier protein] reductase